MNRAALRTAAAAPVLAAAALAHYTWVAPVTEPLAPGKTVTVRIGHGHKFPESEEAINARQVDLFVLAPSGARVKLAPAAAGPAVAAPFQVKEAGLHRIAFVQDRGVTSRTPGGVKPGGRDRNPSATQASRTLRTAVAYAGAPRGAPLDGQPVGLEFELTGTLANGAWTLRLLKQGRPAAGATVEVFPAGAAKAAEAGKTGAGGRLVYRPAAGGGAALFSVALRDPAPKGAAYDFVNYETSLAVSW